MQMMLILMFGKNDAVMMSMSSLADCFYHMNVGLFRETLVVMLTIERILLFCKQVHTVDFLYCWCVVELVAVYCLSYLMK